MELGPDGKELRLRSDGHGGPSVSHEVSMNRIWWIDNNMDRCTTLKEVAEIWGIATSTATTFFRRHGDELKQRPKFAQTAHLMRPVGETIPQSDVDNLPKYKTASRSGPHYERVLKNREEWCNANPDATYGQIQNEWGVSRRAVKYHYEQYRDHMPSDCPVSVAKNWVKDMNIAIHRIGRVGRERLDGLAQ